MKAKLHRKPNWFRREKIVFLQRKTLIRINLPQHKKAVGINKYSQTSKLKLESKKVMSLLSATVQLQLLTSKRIN